MHIAYMSWWLPHKFEQKKPYLERRAALIKAVRTFFDGEGFLEVQTPALQVTPCADAHIHGFKTVLKDAALKPQRDLYLHTSPEFAMKKLLVAGLPKIYQICPVFRNGEGGRLHSPEFTMLEWYRAQSSYRDIMKDCEGLLRECAQKLRLKLYAYRTYRSDPFLKWQYMTVAEAFDKYAGIDLDKFLPSLSSRRKPGSGASEQPDPVLQRDDSYNRAFAEEVTRKNIRTTPNDSWDDLFFAVMAKKIEPNLGIGAPTILYDYPACMAALARKKPEDQRFAERFELYICGIELANGFGELTDAAEQSARFEADMALKQQIYGESYPIDEDFLKALEHGMPESGGIALGIERLAMLVCGVEDIEQVLWTGDL